MSLAYAGDERGGTITHTTVPEYVDDGAEAVRIWSGRPPAAARGRQLQGDAAMLDFTEHADKPFLRLLVLHDDADREFAYTTGADTALDQAARDSWSVVSMKNDWDSVF